MKKALITVALATLLGGSLVQANIEQADLDKYKTATISVNYTGSVGDLVQQLAEQLNLGYYALQANSTARIRVTQEDASLQSLLDSINTQLHHQQVRFDVLDDKIVLILVNNEIKSINTPQFIGTIRFQQQQTDKATEDPLENETLSEPVEQVEPENGIAEQVTNTGQVAAEVNNTLNTESTKPTSNVNQAALDKVREILAVSQDEALLAKYSKRKQPVYQVNDKKRIGLDTIRSTKISTFLIFDKDINTEQYQIIGDFQEIAKLDNIVAILHRQKRPPQTIKIVTPTQEEEVLTNRN